ncbi:hypothetical protein K438DRAFT_1961486 [Mycena galopus ATCC 62051]|nr:hypothetical protein K438DRAFT_1961486 [Mycena galopus ATCC 62051]
MKRQLGKQKKTAAPAAADSGPESEEKNDSDGDGEVVTFQSSIRALAPLPSEPPRPTVVLRKVKKVINPPKTSSRAFLTLPETLPEGPAQEMDDHSEVPSPPASPPLRRIDFAEPPRDHARQRSERDDHSHDITDHSSSPIQRGDSTPATASAGSRKRQQESSLAPPPPAKRKRKGPKEPQFAEGYVFRASVKANASDYEPLVNALLLRAMAEYAMNILIIHAFPDVALQLFWAKACFENACRAANLDFGITDRMIKLITKRGSWIRGQLVTSARILFAPHYKFNRTSASTAVINANRDLSEKLAEGAMYHYKDPNAGTGYAENSILADLRKESIFKKKTSLGVIFASHFNPYPVPALAIEFTVLQHCNSEWSTGKFVSAEFTEKDSRKNYVTHVEDIERWVELNKNVVENLRRKWYNRASHGFASAASGTSSHINKDREDALRAELAGRTGETDSESEQV